MVQDLVKETEAAMQRLDQLHPAFSLAANGISEAMKTRRTLTMQNVQQYCAFDAIGASMEDSGTERSPTADMVMTAEWASWCFMDCEERLVAQADLVRSANPDARVWVYRNLVKALPW